MNCSKNKISYSSALKLLMGLFVASAFLLVQGEMVNAAGGCEFASVGTSDWHTAGNWSCAHVPLLTDDVTIPASTTTVMSDDAVCKGMTMGLGSTLDYGGKTLSAYGTWSSQGALIGNGTTTFAGDLDAAFQVTTVSIFYNLVIAKTAGTVTMDSNATTTNDFTISSAVAGVFILGSNHLAVGGDWSDSTGGGLAGGTGTVEFYGTGAQIIGAEAGFYKLTINKSAESATLTGNVTSTNDVTLQSGTLALGSQILNVGGDWVKTGGLLDGDTGTVRFYKTTAAQRIDAEPNFYNLEIANTDVGTTILDGNVTSTNDLVISSSLADVLSINSFILRVGGDWSDSSGAGLLSGAGTIVLNGTGAQSVSAEANFYDLQVNKTLGTATFTGNVTTTNDLIVSSTGYAGLTMGSYIVHIGDDFNKISGSVTTTGSTVWFDGAGAQTITTQTFNDLVVHKSEGSVALTGNVIVGGTLITSGGSETGFTMNTDTNNLSVTGASTIGVLTVVTSTTGTLTFTGAATNAGSIGSVSGNKLFGSTLANSGALVVGSGVATSTGSLTNTGTIAGNTGKLVLSADYSGAGTFTANTGTVTLYGTAAQAIRGVTFYNLEMRKASNTATINTANPTVGGTLNTYGGGTLTVAALNLTVTGATSLGSGTTVTSTAGDMTFAAVTNAGSLGTVSGNQILTDMTNSGTWELGAESTSTGIVTNTGTLRLHSNTLHVGGNWADSAGTLTPGTGVVELNGTGAQTVAAEDAFYDLTINKTAGTATLTGNVTTTDDLTVTNGTLDIDSYTLSVGDDWSNSDTLDGGTGTVKFNGTGAQSIGTEANFYALVIDKTAGTATLTGHVSTTNLTVTDGTLAVADKILYAPGTYDNNETVSQTTGVIKHDADQIAFVNSSGVEQTSYTTPGNIYLQINDPNLNLLSASAETMTVTMSGNAAAGSDSDTITLTETGIATGIFRSAAIPFVTSPVIHANNDEWEVSGSGVGTLSYTDSQDASDTGTDTSTLVYSAASTGGTGGGGGGGGVSSPVTTYQSSASDPNRSANLANLASMNINVNTLVKLPDDGNLETQEDSAVYFVGKDGKRHAFPNSKVFYTWYTNFDSVIIVSSDKLASIPLGSNVRYRPGSKMLKFTTDPKTYAIGAHGILRWVKTESAAISLYGDDWNTKIDDMSDAFFGNYTFGEDINSISDFNPTAVMSSMLTVSDDYGW